MNKQLQVRITEEQENKLFFASLTATQKEMKLVTIQDVTRGLIDQLPVAGCLAVGVVDCSYQKAGPAPTCVCKVREKIEAMAGENIKVIKEMVKAAQKEETS